MSLIHFQSHHMRIKKKLIVFGVLVIASSSIRAEGPEWKQYSIEESGFTVSFPSPPQSSLLPLPARDGSLRVYQSITPSTRPCKFSIFVGQPEKEGIFESASMDAYLTAHIRSMVATAEGGKLQSSRRLTFRGQPAIEYKFDHRVEGQPYIAQGITFMIDGGHVRLSMWCPTIDPKTQAHFKRFIESFQLIPIAYRAVGTPFVDQRGITFSPPKDWIRQQAQNALQAARFSHLTRSIQLLVAGNSAYTCSNFRTEMQASGRLRSASAVQLGDQQFIKLMIFEDVPKYQLRLTTVQYCINSRFGAVVLTGTEEESMFSRWAQVFEGTAGTLRVR
jgi:hypothetical protein